MNDPKAKSSCNLGRLSGPAKLAKFHENKAVLRLELAELMAKFTGPIHYLQGCPIEPLIPSRKAQAHGTVSYTWR